MKACEAGGLDAVPTACNARICSVAAPFHQCLTHRLPGLQSRRKTEERVSPRRLDGSGWDLQRGVEGTWAQSRLIVRTRECGRCRDGACLRARYAAFFGKAFHSHEKCLSGAATHRQPTPRNGGAAAGTDATNHIVIFDQAQTPHTKHPAHGTRHDTTHIASR